MGGGFSLRELAAIAGHRGDRGLLPHGLRHNCATRLQRRGVELDAIRDLLGHSSVSTTAVYLHTDERRLQEIAEQAAFRPSVAPRERLREEQPVAGAAPPDVSAEVRETAQSAALVWRQAAWRRERRA